MLFSIGRKSLTFVALFLMSTMKKLLLLYFLTFSFPLWTQELAYFTQLTTRNGLSSSEVTSILQDSKGFIWIGTDDGLNKFDGNDLTVYKYNPQVANTIGGNSIRCLFEDSRHNLWIGLKGDGLCKLNLQTGAFKTYKKKNGNGLSYNDVAGVVEDEHGMIWIAVDRGGLDMLNPVTEQFVHYEVQDQHTSQHLNNALTGIITVGDMFVLSSWGGGVYCFDKKHKKFSLHPYWAAQKPDKELCKHIFSLYKDKDKRIWVVSAHGGLYSLDEQSKSYKHYDLCKIAANCEDNLSVRAVSDDGKGNLWIVTSTGLRLLNKKNGSITTLETSHLTGENLKYTYTDNAGLMWLSVTSGVYYFSPTSTQFKSLKIKGSFAEKQVLSVFKDSKHNLWVGGLNSFHKIAPDRKTIITYSNRLYNKNTSLYQAICEDAEGNIWIGNYSNQLIKYNPLTQTFTQIDIPPPTGTNYAYHNLYNITLDWDNSLWLATELGAVNYNPTTQTFKPLFESKNIIYPEDKTRVIYRDQEMQLWIGSERGLKRYTRDLRLKKVYTAKENDPNTLSNDFITAILEDHKGNLWIGTKEGLHRFDKKTEKFELLRRTDAAYGDPIFGLAEDGKGNLWMSTPSAVLRYNISEKKFQTFNEYDGLQSAGFQLGAFSQAKDGELLIGGKEGLNTFYPQSLTINRQPPKVVISDFQIFNKSISPEQGGVLTRLIDETSAITLKHSQSVISFRFSALNYKASAKNQYAYMLEGFDNDWTYSSSQRIATYTNLNPGTYTFKVKAANNDGVWNDTPHHHKAHRYPALLAYSLGLHTLCALGYCYYRVDCQILHFQRKR